MAIQAILFDLDGVLFDFQKNSRQALAETFAHVGIPFSDEQFALYDRINDELWKRYERGEIEKDFIFHSRFREYLAQRGVKADPDETNDFYMRHLAAGVCLITHCIEVLQALHGVYRLFAVTNADAYVQHTRMQTSGLEPFFDGVFISEEMGCKKPEPQFFDQVFAAIGEGYRKSSILVGDSLSSDMQGGRNAGVCTCFFGRLEDADERCDYCIQTLPELLPLLERLSA